MNKAGVSEPSEPTPLAAAKPRRCKYKSWTYILLREVSSTSLGFKNKRILKGSVVEKQQGVYD